MLYEVTLTLRPHLYRFTYSEQLRTIRPLLDTIFKPCIKQEYKVSLVSEPTGENNCHLHGIIELRDFKDRDRFLNRIRPMAKTFGRKTVTPIVNYPKWVEYINKDKDLSRQLSVDPIIYDDFVVLCDQQFRTSEELPLRGSLSKVTPSPINVGSK